MSAARGPSRCRWVVFNVQFSVFSVQILVGEIAGSDFITQLSAPRELVTGDILSGDREKLEKTKNGLIAAEDILWALSGALDYLKEKNTIWQNNLGAGELALLGNVLLFIGCSRADIRASFFYLLVKECGLFTRIPMAIKTINDEKIASELFNTFSKLVAE